MAERIAASDLVPMDLFTAEVPLQIDLVYADAAHLENIFGQALYHPTARLFLHVDLAAVVLLAARDLHERQGWVLQLKDGLRTVEAQEKMMATAIVQRNPHWYEGPDRLLSPPGAGAHPRGMAIDVGVLDRDGAYVDMGTAFDHLSQDPSVNPAARTFKDLSTTILERRTVLETAFLKAAARLSLPILPLPSEWWDFRFPRGLYDLYQPLHEGDLPDGFKMCGANHVAQQNNQPIHSPAVYDILKRIA